MGKTILVVDDQQVFRESILDVLKLRGFDVLEADSVPAALAVVAKSTPDLALVDICMPDYDGIEFLRMINVRNDRAKIPVILMTAQPKREYLEQAAKLGVRDFVVKSSFSVQELVLRIEMRIEPEESNSVSTPAPPPAPPPNSPREQIPSRSSQSTVGAGLSASAAVSQASSASSLGPISTLGPLGGSDPREELAHKRKKIAARVRLFRNIEAKALPGPVTEILELAASMTASLVQLETVVRRDPVLAARVLSLANSAAHRGANLVGQLDEALRNVGIDSVVEMIASIQLVERETLHGRVGRDLASIWWHCLATAVFCDRLAPGHVRPGAYLAGLFHDLPILFALQALGKEWLECRQKALDELTAPSEALAEAFGMVPGQLAQEVYTRYRLPESIAGPLRDYHNICLGRQPRDAGELPQRVDAAHNLAVALGWGWSELAEVRPLSQDEGRSWRDIDRLALELPQIAEDIRKLGALAGLPEPDVGPEEDAELWGGGGIAYWRDPRYRVPDPIEHVLSRARFFDAYDNPETFLKVPGGRKVAVVEPESSNWKTILGATEPVLVLHKSALGNIPAPAGFRFLRLPVPVCVLRETLNMM